MGIALGVKIYLKNELSGGLLKLNKEVKKNLGIMKKHINGFKNSLNSVAKAIRNFAVVGAIGLGKLLNDSRLAFNAYNLELTKFRTLIKNTKGFTDEQGEALINYASELKKSGVLGDTQILAGMQQISTFQLQASSIKVLTEGMTDLVAQQKGVSATSQDFVSVGNLIGKVMSGQVGALSKVGIIFNKNQERILKYGNEQQRAATLAQVLKENVGGVNKALKNTPEGAMAHLKNQFVDMQKVVGEKLQPIMNTLLQKIIENIPKIQNSLNRVVNKLESLAPFLSEQLGNAIEYAFKALEKFLNMLEFIGEHKNIVKPLIISFISLKITLKALSIFYSVSSFIEAFTFVVQNAEKETSLFQKVLKLLKATMVKVGGAFKWLKGLMVAHPFGAIVVAIIVVIGVLVLLYKKCDWFREKVNKLWAYLKLGFKKWKDGVVLNIKIIVNSFKTFINKIKSIFSIVVNFIAKGLEMYFNYIKSVFNFVVIAIKWYFNYIATVIKFITKVIKSCISIFATIINKIKSIFTSVFKFIAKVFKLYISIYTKIIMSVFNFIKSIITRIVENIMKVKEKINAIIEYIKPMFETIKSFVINVVGGAFEYVGSIFKKIFGWISKITNGVKTVVNKVKNAFTSDKNDINVNANFNHLNNNLNDYANNLNNKSYIPRASDTVNKFNTTNNNTSNKKTQVVNATVNIQGNVIGNKQFANDITTHILNGINTEMRNI